MSLTAVVCVAVAALTALNAVLAWRSASAVRLAPARDWGTPWERRASRAAGVHALLALLGVVALAALVSGAR